jgi:hypothetical protein
MQKVQMVYFGTNVLVDRDQVALLKRKEQLVRIATELKGTQAQVDAVAKIIKINRRIRNNVMFV